MRQFFEDDGNRLSMARLCMFGAWAGSTVALLWSTYEKTLTEVIYLGYCGTWGSTYVLGKRADKLPDKGKPDGTE